MLETSFLYLSITEKAELQFHFPKLVWLKKNFPSIQCFDLDNHSDSLLFSYAIDFVEKSQKLLVYIEKSENGSGQKFLQLYQKLTRKKEPYLVLMEGEDELTEKMLSFLGEKQFRKITLETGFEILAEGFLT